MALKFHQFAYNSDNYGVLIHDPATAQTACVDAGDAGAVFDALRDTGCSLSELWITHHHWDHTDGLAELKTQTGCRVIGPEGIKGVDQVVRGGDSFAFAGHTVELIHTPGHTLDMLNFYIPEVRAVFTGDTLFVMGCGRLFEGGGPMMWASLQKLMALPPDTVVYCAHEYTLASAAFALSIDPDNAALQAQVARVKALRDKDAPTVPTDMATELATNPFLRPSDKSIRENLGLQNATDAEVFTEIRARKDSF